MRTNEPNYPLWIPLLSVLQVLAIYTLGVIILFPFGLITVLAYVLFCLWSEYRVLRMSCRYCYYYGKLCGTGKGLIAPLFGKKGDPKLFISREISWKDLIPDFLLFLIPLIMGMIDLSFHFSPLTLGLIVAIVTLAMPGSGFMRGCLLCPNCKQRELGCPAEKLFNKKENK